MIKHTILFVAIVTLLGACVQNNTTEDKNLPILGNREVVNGDTVYHKVPDFSFINQDSQVINNATFKDKAYLVDFFFTTCPSICPKVKQQMLRIYDKFDGEARLGLMSHTIDTKHDSVPVLKRYADDLGIPSGKWHFVTGDKDKIFDIADEYFIAAIEDANAPGGFDHSGRIILVDKNRHIRAFGEGTDPESIDKFMVQIQQLLDEM